MFRRKKKKQPYIEIDTRGLLTRIHLTEAYHMQRVANLGKTLLQDPDHPIPHDTLDKAIKIAEDLHDEHIEEAKRHLRH